MAPDTDCPLCWHAEATRLQRAMRRLAGATDPNYGTAELISNMTRAYAAMLTGRPPGWYERHRSAFVDSGRPAELHRMLRHVNIA